MFGFAWNSYSLNNVLDTWFPLPLSWPVSALRFATGIVVLQVSLCPGVRLESREHMVGQLSSEPQEGTLHLNSRPLQVGACIVSGCGLAFRFIGSMAVEPFQALMNLGIFSSALYVLFLLFCAPVSMISM